jgi:hypothetical protein
VPGVEQPEKGRGEWRRQSIAVPEKVIAGGVRDLSRMSFGLMDISASSSSSSSSTSSSSSGTFARQWKFVVQTFLARSKRRGQPATVE